MVLKRTILILSGHYIMFSFAKQYQKISILPSQKGLEFPGGGGFFKTQKFKKSVKFYWNFQRGSGEGLRKTPFCGGGMDIFWSYTLSPHMAH